jgi:hypothetical protein
VLDYWIVGVLDFPPEKTGSVRVVCFGFTLSSSGTFRFTAEDFRKVNLSAGGAMSNTMRCFMAT